MGGGASISNSYSNENTLIDREEFLKLAQRSALTLNKDLDCLR
jgi:hypothetical protein